MKLSGQKILALTLAAFVGLSVTTPAHADWYDGYHWHHGRHPHGWVYDARLHYYVPAPGYVVAAPGTVVVQQPAPAPVVVAAPPQPVYVQPQPAYVEPVAPAVGLSVHIH